MARKLFVLLFCVVGGIQIYQLIRDAKASVLFYPYKQDVKPDVLFYPYKQDVKPDVVVSSHKQEVQHVKLDVIASSHKQEIQGVKIRTIVDNDFCIAANIIHEIGEFERITLLLHVSHDRLNDKVLKNIENWNGPVSLAVAFPGSTEFNSTIVKCAIDMLLEWKVRHDSIKKRLSVHFLSKNVSNCDGFIIHETFKASKTYNRVMSEEECKSKNETLTANQLAEKLVTYPVNRARNVARKFATTKYILPADMDHHFSNRFEDKMLELAKRQLKKDPKTVLVYRIFEVSRDVQRLPRTKEDLLKLYIEGTAQEFHKYYGVHSIPRLYDWFMNPENNYSTEIQFYKPYTSISWEPRFVALNNIPEHDETFTYSRRDNACLRWEMCRAGFKFAIVHNVFTVHLGFKDEQERLILVKARRIVGRKQKDIVSDFNKRLDKLYKTTKNICPTYS